MAEERPYVFISYAFDDQYKMAPIVEYLENRNLRCWYAPRDIPYGKNYQTAIVENLKKAAAVVVLITEKVGEAKFVQKEVERALAYSKFVIPVLVDGSPIPANLEFFLCDIQWVNLPSFATQEEGFSELATYLGENLHGHELELEIKRSPSFKQLEVVSDTSNVLLYRTHPDTLRKTSQRFVAPPEFGKMERGLTDHHLLYLHHPYHTGKYSTALALFSRLGIEEVHEWSKDATFNQIFQHPLRERAGYLIEIGSPQFFQTASESMLDTYIKQLKEKRAYFLFIATDEPGDHFLPYSVKVSPPEDTEQLLLNHVEEEDAGLKEQITQWIRDQAAEGKLPQPAQPREAPEIVTRIRKLVRGELDEHAFMESLRENVQGRVNGWFKQERSLEEIAFYLTVSLFQGQPYDTITAKARQLASILAERIGKEADGRLHNIARDECLLMFHATVKTGWKVTEVGKELQEQIFLSSESDATYIWEYVWTQFPAYREAMKEWFDQLLAEGHRWAEDQISQMVITLLKRDFSSVRHALIQPWAMSESKREQFLVVRMLEWLSLDLDWSHVVFRLIQSWLRQFSNGRLRWTAIALLGSQAGALYFPHSLKLLEEAYATGYKLRYAIGRSLQNLSGLPLQIPGYELIYYRFWLQWFKRLTGKDKSYAYKFAQTVFLSHPALFLDTTSKGALEFWVRFIRLCYQDRISRNTTYILLERWVLAASGNPKREERLATLFARVYREGDEGVKSRIVRFIQKGLRKDEELYLPYKSLIS
ncbi:toll/interleukin-1 receptor domain-containing protein [Laceyella putida]|uniref:Toll/interleukin-1 receptor domain-containing protein n=1 Tax=Laceyella putida TaxID=110101 RepID=A0ABW2RJP1_9BACL